MVQDGVRLKKEFGLLGVFCIASGAMISSGLFVLPAIAFGMTGPSVVLAYFLAGVLMVPSMLAQCELGTAMPRAGGTYFYIERSMGTLAGTFGGMANWFSISFKSAFALIGMGVYARLLLPNISNPQIKAIAIGCCLVFTLLNLFSVRGTGRVQTYLVLSLIAILVAYIVGGFGSGSITLTRFDNFVREGPTALFATVGLIFISYGGLTKVASISEEVRNPGKTIPQGMLLAFVTMNLMYVLVVFVTVGALDADSLGKTYIPISDGARIFMGPVGSGLLAAAALLAFITTANAGLLSASRAPLAMSRDNLIPRFFEAVSPRFGTPYVGILFTSAFMIAVILFLGIEDLVKTASTLMLLLFILVNVSLIIMRESRIAAYRPTFRAPLYPWLQVGAVLVYLFLIVEMGLLPLLIAGGFVAVGLGWYLLYGRFRAQRQSALIHVVERITAREVAGATLGTELRHLLRERDNIVEDRFDRIIQTCEILDLDESLDVREFFDRIADIIALRLDANRDTVRAMLLARESESTTVVSPGLAIPHIIVEGKGKFDILVVRCKTGIVFSESQSPVHLVFVLAGSRDERPFHLRALMSIAQIAQQPRFEKQCLHARDTEEIRNIILISERRREPA